MVLRLLTQEIARAFSRALLIAGNSIAARIAMMAMTTELNQGEKRRFSMGRTLFVVLGAGCHGLGLWFAEMSEIGEWQVHLYCWVRVPPILSTIQTFSRSCC